MGGVCWLAPGSSDGEKTSRSSCFRNNDGLCEHHTARKKSQYSTDLPCHWCGAPVKRDDCLGLGFSDYRNNSTGLIKCPACTKKHQALLKSLDHWIENVENFKSTLDNHSVWFRNHCLSNKCACCEEFLLKDSRHVCGECPLDAGAHNSNITSIDCCDGLWYKASNKAEVEKLQVTDLEKIRDYIYLVCINQGIVQVPGVHERMAQTINYFKRKYGHDNFIIRISLDLAVKLFPASREEFTVDVTLKYRGYPVRIYIGAANILWLEPDIPKGICLPRCPEYNLMRHQRIYGDQMLIKDAFWCKLGRCEGAGELCPHGRGYKITPVGEEK